MVKKIIICALMLILTVSIVAFGANEETPQQPAEENIQMPREEFNQEGRMRGERPMPSGEMPPMANGEIPETPRTPNENGEISQGENNTTENWQRPNGNMEFGGRGPFGRGFNENEMQNPTQEVGLKEEVNFFEEYFTPILSVVLLVLAFIFVIFYKKKSY